MGFLDALKQAYRGASEPELLAEDLLSRPWTVSVGVIAATATVRQHFDSFGLKGRVYRLERVTIVNNNGSVAITVRPNGDLLREVRIGSGGGSAVIDHGDIVYLEITNTHAVTNTVAGDVIIAGDAFRRH